MGNLCDFWVHPVEGSSTTINVQLMAGESTVATGSASVTVGGNPSTTPGGTFPSGAAATTFKPGADA